MAPEIPTSLVTTVTHHDDVVAIEAFFQQWGYGDFRAGTLVEMMRFAPNQLIMIAEDDNQQPVAALCYRLLDDEAEIIEIAVRQDKQREGFGARLMREVMRRVTNTSVERLLLEVAETNYKALSFYQYLGFQEIARRRAYYHKSIDAIIMELRLSKA